MSSTPPSPRSKAATSRWCSWAGSRQGSCAGTLSGTELQSADDADQHRFVILFVCVHLRHLRMNASSLLRPFHELRVDAVDAHVDELFDRDVCVAGALQVADVAGGDAVDAHGDQLFGAEV